MSAAVDLDMTALHEAGHAIVGQALGYRMGEVSLRPDGGGLCEAELEPRDSLDAIQRELSFMLAGRLAVALAGDEDWNRLSFGNTLELEWGSWARQWGLLCPSGWREYADSAAPLLGPERFAHRWLDDEALPAAAGEAVRILRERWVDVQGLAIRLSANRNVDLGESHRRDSLERAIERQELALRRSATRYAQGAGRALPR